MQPSYDDLLKENALLRAENQELRQRLELLEERLGLSSKNSSKPPSLDQKPNHEPPKNKGGAQKGHPHHRKHLIDKEGVDLSVECGLASCPSCERADLVKTARLHTLHQHVEFADRRFRVEHYNRPLFYCKHCRRYYRGALPEGKESCYGPGLTSCIACLNGSYHLSWRGISRLLQELSQIPLSIGAIGKALTRVSNALHGSYEELQDRARRAGSDVHYVDETSWRHQHRNGYLCLVTTEDYALYRLAPSRSRRELLALFPDFESGAIVTDDYSAYLTLPGPHQQCLAHRMRHLIRFAERPGLTGVYATEMLRHMEAVFAAWKSYKSGELSRSAMQRRCGYRRREIGLLLREVVLWHEGDFQRSCKRALQRFDRWWTFLRVEGMEPTNNLAERDLRGLVMWRKRSFGTRSDVGKQFVERMSSVVQTLRKQGRDVLAHLTAIMSPGIPAPALMS